MHQQTLLLGIGNTLLTDEGAGVHAMTAVQNHLGERPGINYIDGGTLSFTLASEIEDSDTLIVFDAAEMHQPAGSVHVFIGNDMDAFLGRAKRSPHEVGLLDLMDIARLTDALPTRRALVGVQPETFEWGMSPSPAVQKAMPDIVTETLRLLCSWQIIDTDQYRKYQSHVNVCQQQGVSA